MGSAEADRLQARLEESVFMVMSVRRSVAQPAAALARRPADERERFLASVGLLSRTSVELAYQFCHFGLAALARVPEAHWQDWVLQLLDRYDSGGVMAAIQAMQGLDRYLGGLDQAARAVDFDSAARILGPFIQGLNGRPLKLAAGETFYTDTETLYLPARVAGLTTREANFRLYKAAVAHLWAQTWFGTWRPAVAERLAAETDTAVLARFHALERLRLDACIARELPGLSRETATLAPQPAGPWREAGAALAHPEASVEDSLAWLERVGGAPPACPYQGVLRPAAVTEVLRRRLEREQRALRQALRRVLDELALPDGVPLETRPRRDPEAAAGWRHELYAGDTPLAVPAEVRALFDSIVQDLGEIPPEYLQPAGHGGYDAGATDRRAGPPVAVDEADYVYDEWDYQRGGYRKGWCLLRERSVHPVHDDFVARTRARHRGLLRHLQRSFEALRGEDRRLRRQPDGEDLDLDAAVAALADHRDGREWPRQVFIRRRRVDRDVAVMLLVDMSGSTDGWINDLEREALVLLCEALEILGDRYAIYGFSGFTHKRCDLYRVKEMDEPYDEQVQARISGIRPKEYTRFGVAIRHLTRRFQEVAARTRLLVTLSDGRPDDQDGYRGAYGIEDTRRALLEARGQAVHPYCITIDDQAMDYLPHMYGPSAFSVVDDVHRLPYRVAEIYRRITF